MLQQLEKQEEDAVEIQQTFSDLRQEVDAKSKKIKKLMMKLRQVSLTPESLFYLISRFSFETICFAVVCNKRATEGDERGVRDILLLTSEEDGASMGLFFSAVLSIPLLRFMSITNLSVFLPALLLKPSALQPH